MKLTSLIFLVILSGCLFDLKGRDIDESAGLKDKGAPDNLIAGMRLFNSRDFKGARREFYRIIEEYPGNKLLHEAQWMIARAYEEEGDLKNALGEYRLFLKNYPGSIHFQDAEVRIESIEKRSNGAIERLDGKLIGIKLTEDLLKGLTAKELRLLHQFGINTIVVELKAGSKQFQDDLKTIIDAFHQDGFEIFAEIDIRDPGWVDNLEAIELAYDPVDRRIVRSTGLDLFNRDVVANLAAACRDIASNHPDGIILKGYGYGRYEGLGRYIRGEFYKDFGYQLEPERLFLPADQAGMTRQGSSYDTNQEYSGDFWRWSGWKARKIYKFIGRIMKGCRETDRSIRFGISFHHEAIDNPPLALALYSEDILEANRYRPDYLLITVLKDGPDINLLSKGFSRFINNNQPLFEVVLDDSAHLVNVRSLLSNQKIGAYSGVIFIGRGGIALQDLDLF